MLCGVNILLQVSTKVFELCMKFSCLEPEKAGAVDQQIVLEANFSFSSTATRGYPNMSRRRFLDILSISHRTRAQPEN
jgi:hypothetical protein